MRALQQFVIVTPRDARANEIDCLRKGFDACLLYFDMLCQHTTLLRYDITMQSILIQNLRMNSWHRIM